MDNLLKRRFVHIGEKGFMKAKRPVRGSGLRIGAIAACALIMLIASDTAAVAAPPIVWVVDGMQRVKPDTPPEVRTSIELFAARGEYEPFQIIVRGPSGGLSKVSVLAQDLIGPGGQRISRNNITLYREHFVYLTRGSSDWGGTNRPLGPGWYPEPLIPFVNPETGQDLSGAQLDAVPFQLQENKNEAIWIDLFVPRGAVPGQYTGKFTVTSDQGQVDVNLALTVWNFELPFKPGLKSAFLIWGSGDKQSYIELMKHKLMPDSLRDVRWEREFIDHYGLTMTNVGFYSGADISNCNMYAAPSVSSVQTEVARHQPDLLHYSYVADEIGGCTNLWDEVKEYGRNLRAGGVHPLLVMPPVRELLDDGSGTGESAADIWVLLPVQFGSVGVSEAMAKGDEIWSYNTLVQDSFSPKWTLDFAPINMRIQPGFISQTLGLKGLLYWRVDYWVTGSEWDNLTRYGAAWPGEGALVFPGKQVGLSGVCPGMRLKWLREGVEDWEYIEILKSKGGKDLALSIAKQIGPDWRNWTRSTDALYAARKALGEEIHRLFSEEVRKPMPPQNLMVER
jgi:hypothetical protein